jgi:UDP-N-acetylmuramate dehydrogenase
VEELHRLLANAQKLELPHFPLGNGSKILVADGGFDGLVVHLRGLAWEFFRCDDDGLRVGPGLPLAKFSRHCLELGIPGYEFCSGIPGTIGGALRMNAGAFGSSIGDRVLQMTYLDKLGMVHVEKQPKFSYRTWQLPESCILLEALMQVPQRRTGGEEIRAVMKKLAHLRRERQPGQPSAGSVFSNPQGRLAWELIDAAGLRGLAKGGARISPVHANFIVNGGHATAADVLWLIFKIREEVHCRFAIDLTTEMEYLSNHWIGRL